MQPLTAVAPLDLIRHVDVGGFRLAVADEGFVYVRLRELEVGEVDARDGVAG